MKNSSRNGYNIYNVRSPRGRRRSRNDRRKLFVVTCLFICMTCLILDVIFVAKLTKKSKKEVTPTTTSSDTSLETDESGNVIVPPESDPSATDTTETTVPAKTQTVDAATRSANLTALQTKVAEYLGQQNGRYGVYYLNLENGETMGYKEDQPIVAASAIKIAYNTYLYERAAAGEFSMQDKMAYNAAGYVDGVTGGDYEGGTGNIQNSADGTEFTLQEVSHRSITISDNCGTNMVLRKLGGEEAVNNNYMKTISSVVDYRSKVEYTDYTGNSVAGRRRTCALDLAKYAEHLYKDYTADETTYKPLIDDLCNTEYNWGVASGVPQDIAVAHKVGFRGNTFNDIAIVFGTEDYVLCIMTESGSEQKAKEIMGEVSKMVYEYVESCYA